MQKIDSFWKWLCIVLAATVLYLGAYNWRDVRYDRMVSRAYNLAKALSQMNNLLSAEQAQLIQQVNAVLDGNGYPQLVRKIAVQNEEAKDEPTSDK